jgi:hypothetical protein
MFGDAVSEEILPPDARHRRQLLTAVKNSFCGSESNDENIRIQYYFMTMIKGIVALVLALCSGSAVAETVYKYQRPDGSMVYSDKPIANARLVGRFQLLPLPPAGPQSSGPAPNDAGRGARAVEQRARQRALDLDAVDMEIKSADQALKDAQERQQADQEPLPGERIGNVAGRGSRLRPEYFERQQRLASEVEQARAWLDRAYRDRDELR